VDAGATSIEHDNLLVLLLTQGTLALYHAHLHFSVAFCIVLETLRTVISRVKP
jgi:hypothetical protein